jgi:hypothetical protein
VGPQPWRAVSGVRLVTLHLAASDPLTVPTWITAITTAILAIGAAFTAVFAYLAFRKQSEEVKEQSEMLRVQSGQLDAQRDQLYEQQKINVKQTGVLELQARELRESLDARKREAAERRRAQASKVFIWEERTLGPTTITQTPGATGQDWWVTAHVSNTSDQPVYDLEFRWQQGAALSGQPDHIAQLLPGAEVQKARIAPLGAEVIHFGAVLRFRDAAGVNWLRRPDGELSEWDG